MSGRKRKMIQTAVRDVINKSRENEEIVTGTKYLRDKTRSVVIRATWAFFIATCTLLTLYQICERIGYFFLYPVAVNYAYSDTIDPRMVPTVTICSTDTAKFAELRMKYDLDRKKLIMDRYCLMDVVRIVDHLNITAEEWWSYLNASSIITSLEYQRGTKRGFLDRSSIVTHNLPFGSCATVTVDDGFDADSISVVLKKHNGSCMTSRLVMTSQKQGVSPYLPMTISSATGVHVYMYALIKMYYFANTPVTPCSDDKWYQNCYKKCLIKKYEEHENISCKYPFVPEEVQKPFCKLQDANKTHESFVAMNKVLMRTHPIHDCKCFKLCLYLGNNFYGTSVPIDPYTTILTTVKTVGFTTVTEHRSYEAIALFCDIGGNMGLFLGFSTLSLLEALIVLGRSVSIKKRYPNARAKFIYRRVSRLHVKVKKEQSTTAVASITFWQELFPADKSFVVNLIRILTQCLCMICCVYLVYNRIEYYFTYPTRTVVKITHNVTVTFPDVTICGLSDDILNGMTVLSKMDSDKFPDYCKVSLVDFLDHFPAEAVWNETRIRQNFFFLDTNIAENYFSMPLVKNYSMEEVYLPEGICTKFGAGKRMFYGTTTMLNIIGRFAEECTLTLNMYLALHGEEVDLRNKLPFRLAVQSATTFEIRKIVRENVPQRPCVDEKVFKSCAERCFRDKLSASMSCRLPYMKDLPSTTPMCNATKSGSEAQTSYLTLSASHFPTKDCSCITPCIENILVALVINEPYKGPDVTINSLMFISNIFEQYVEVRDYLVVKMLCDIGGIMGIALGFSILSIMDIIHSALSKCNAKLQLLRSAKKVRSNYRNI